VTVDELVALSKRVIESYGASEQSEGGNLARGYLALVEQISYSFCVWCGHRCDRDDTKTMTDHMLTCDKSPLVRWMNIGIELQNEREAIIEALREIAFVGGSRPAEMGEEDDGDGWWKRIAAFCISTAARALPKSN
jgi:hypothetical protein